MAFLSIVNIVFDRVSGIRQRRRDMRALRGMNAHMLKDIGLRWEAEEIVPLYPESLDDAQIEHPVRGFDRDKAVERDHLKGRDGTAVDASRTTPEGESNAQILVCRHCGERLA